MEKVGVAEEKLWPAASAWRAPHAHPRHLALSLRVLEDQGLGKLGVTGQDKLAKGLGKRLLRRLRPCGLGRACPSQKHKLILIHMGLAVQRRENQVPVP